MENRVHKMEENTKNMSVGDIAPNSKARSGTRKKMEATHRQSRVPGSIPSL